MRQVLFHFKKSALRHVQQLGYNYKINDNEIDVILPDIEYDYDHSVIDPDVQLCVKYGIDYNQLNCIELA